MGYFGTGFVFTSEPNWEALAKLGQAINLTGYQHKKQKIWLLDAWSSQEEKHWPFCEPVLFEFDGPVAIPTESEVILRTVNQVVTLLAQSEDTYGEEWLRLAVRVSQLAGAGTFFFASDDEGIDMAVNCAGGFFKNFRIEYICYLLSLRDGHVVVAPQEFDEEEEDEVGYDPNVLSELEKLAGITTVAVTKPKGLFYENVRELWPVEAGDPAATLGIGTYDPFDNLEKDFSLVWNRAAVQSYRLPYRAYKRYALNYLISKIVPVLRTTPSNGAWGEEIPPDLHPVSEPLIADLHVCYACSSSVYFSRPEKAELINFRDCAAMGIQPSELRALALSNLHRESGGFGIRQEGSIFAVTTEVFRSQAVCLLDDDYWNSQAGRVRGELVAAAPRLDVLVFTGSESATDLAVLYEIVQGAFEQGEFLLSRSFFIRRGGAWRKCAFDR